MPTTVTARPALLRALGRAEPPNGVSVEGADYRLVEVFKHDSWAATARYARGRHEIVCKFNRQQRILGVPMRWLGHALARREAEALHRLAGVAGIPRGCGPVSAGGRPLPNAVAHDYIDGHPLASHEQVGREFFSKLKALLQQVHDRGIAYVDLHKRENILVGRDGRPWLIDFQVCYGYWRTHHANGLMQQFLMRHLQELDLYHLAKHVLRHRPQQLQELELMEYRDPPQWIHGHRRVTVPLRTLRRRLLMQLRVRGLGGKAASEAFPEDAVRREKLAA